MVTYTLTLYDNDVLAMDEATGAIVISDEYFEDFPEGMFVEIHFEEDAENIYHKYQLKEHDEENHVVTLDWLEQIGSELLTEAPVVKLTDDELNDPSKIDIKTKIADAEEKEAEERAAQEKATKEQELRTKHAGLLDKVEKSLETSERPSDTLEVLFEALVPSSGAAETVAGEIVRAMMRLLYRDANDGDKFFMSYGLETCGSSAQYLFDMGFEAEIQNMLNNALQLADDDDKYTEALEELTISVINRLLTDVNLLAEVNEEDSRDYPNDYIEENQPKYDFEIPCSDDVVRLVEEGVVNSWDLNSYVEDQLQWNTELREAEVERPFSHHDTSVTLSNVSRDGLDLLEDMVRNIDGFWADFVADHQEELDELDSDEDFDDDYEEEDEE